ncbi:YesU family protein [Arthrobacter sp. ZGTC412]|uniref:YesU family protein n=1 Tax=Arthrobacter sp. ZGTC412 TaxID=2058900 RepID=UPI00215844B8|nr:YesU family protein [Arthrobacter sp. ZGTC412]
MTYALGGLDFREPKERSHWPDGLTDTTLFSQQGAALVGLSGVLDDEEFGDHAHWSFWCPDEFPGGIRISWQFFPVEEVGFLGHAAWFLFVP